MSQEVIFNPKRTPEVFYLKEGFITFYKAGGQVHFFVQKYNRDGSIPATLIDAVLRDEQHLKQLQSVTTLDQLLPLLDLGDVKQ